MRIAQAGKMLHVAHVAKSRIKREGYKSVSMCPRVHASTQHAGGNVGSTSPSPSNERTEEVGMVNVEKFKILIHL